MSISITSVSVSFENEEKNYGMESTTVSKEEPCGDDIQSLSVHWDHKTICALEVLSLFVIHKPQSNC